MTNIQYTEKTLSSVDRILVDTSTLMSPGFQQFISNNKGLLLAAGKKLIVPRTVYMELARHVGSIDSEKSEHAMAAVELLSQTKDIFTVVNVPFTEEELAHAFADAQLLSVTREQGVIERDKEDKEENHNFVPDDLSGYKYIEKGDFAINKMKAWQGSYAVSEYNGIVSPAYFTCKLKGVNKDFFSKAIRSKVYVPFFTQYSKGIRVGQWDLNPNALKSIPFLLPMSKV